MSLQRAGKHYEKVIAESIRIMDVFVAMCRALASLDPLLSRIEATERRRGACKGAAASGIITPIVSHNNT